jgi:hypothetical protein
MGGECGIKWENRNAFRVLVGKLERKRALARAMRKLEDNIKMDLQETGWLGSNWFGLAHGTDKWQAPVNA